MREANVFDGSFVSEPSFANRIDFGGVDRNEIPHADSIVFASGNDAFSIRTNIDAVLFLERLAQRVESLAGFHVPDFDRRVGTSAHDDFRIGRKVEIVDRTVVTFQGSQLLAGFGVPQNDLSIVTSRRHEF